MQAPAAPAPRGESVSAPALTVPNVSAPALTVPNVSAPALTMPNVSAPALTVPNVSAPALTVQIVSYNTRDLTLRCLATLLAATAEPMRVVVLDNASDDGSAEAVAAAYPEVELIRAPANLGFARANNVIAETVTTEWLLLLNSDTEVLPGAVDKLLAFARANAAHGIYGGRTLFADGSLNPGSCYGRLTPWSAFCSATGLVALRGSRLFNSEHLGGWARDSVREVDIVSGCFFLIRTALWRELGGFDARFFMYGEEVDLCARARARGARPVMTPAATIVHLGGASRSSPAAKRIQNARARASIVALHWPAVWRPWGRAMLWLWAADRYAASVALDRLGLDAAGRRALWAEVWRARGDWLAGWRPAGDPRPPAELQSTKSAAV